jgi:hypothetical protein
MLDIILHCWPQIAWKHARAKMVKDAIFYIERYTNIENIHLFCYYNREYGK